MHFFKNSILITLLSTTCLTAMNESGHGAFFDLRRPAPIETYFGDHSEPRKVTQEALSENTMWSEKREIYGSYTLNGNWKTLTFAKNTTLVIKAHSVLHLQQVIIEGTPCIKADPTSKIILDRVIWHLAPNKELSINTLQVLNHSLFSQNNNSDKRKAILNINNIIINPDRKLGLDNIIIKDAVIDFESATSTLELSNTTWEAFRICIPQGKININAPSFLKSTDKQEGLIKKDCEITIAKNTTFILSNFVIQGNPITYKEETSKLHIEHVTWELEKNLQGDHVILGSNNSFKAPKKIEVEFNVLDQSQLQQQHIDPNCEFTVNDFVITDGASI